MCCVGTFLCGHTSGLGCIVHRSLGRPATPQRAATPPARGMSVVSTSSYASLPPARARMPDVYSFAMWACCTRTRRISPVTDGSDARSLCAQFCGQHSSRVPQWLLKRLDSGTRHTVASATVTCLRHSSNGRPIGVLLPASLRKSRSRATSRRRRRWATSLVERARPHDSGSGPCTPQKSSAGHARPPFVLEHPSISSTLTVGRAMPMAISSPTVSAC